MKIRAWAVLAIVELLACGEAAKPTGALESHNQAADAGADSICYVYVHGDCHGWVAPDTWFGDDGNGASSNAGVCLHRAREYATWCGLINPFDLVYAGYVWNGTLVMAQRFEPGFDFGNVDPRVTTYGVNWVPLATSPSESTVLGAQTWRAPNVWSMQ